MAAFHQRNEWMGDHSSRLIATHNGNPVETRNTIEYAKRKSSKSLSMTQTVELSTQSAKKLKYLVRTCFSVSNQLKHCDKSIAAWYNRIVLICSEHRFEEIENGV